MQNRLFFSFPGMYSVPVTRKLARHSASMMFLPLAKLARISAVLFGSGLDFSACWRFVIVPHLMYLFAVKSRCLSRALSMSTAKIIFSALLFLALATSARAQVGAVVINELAASNDSSVENGGNFPDWIELYN